MALVFFIHGTADYRRPLAALVHPTPRIPRFKTLLTKPHTITSPPNRLATMQRPKEEKDSLRNRLPFVVTAGDLPLDNVLYAGQQHVDELDTYVFDIAPKHVDKDGGKRFFQGRIWVDGHDFQIVKTC